MFNLFGKKSSSPVTDLVWVSSGAKNTGLVKLIRENSDAVLVAWFDETVETFESYLSSQGMEVPVYSYRTIPAPVVNGKTLVMLEHYPLAEKENSFFESHSASKILVLSALDEPLFKRFGGDKIVDMMRKLGMDENESVSHALISSAIRNAQEKIGKKVQMEQSSRSALEWLERNYS